MSFSTLFFYARYGVTYRDIEAIMKERGVKIAHSTLNRWVSNYSSSMALAVKKLNALVISKLRVKEFFITSC